MLTEIGVAGGITSKFINDSVDKLKSAYKDADIQGRAKHQNLQTRIYRVIMDALNVFTGGKYSDRDVLCDAAECILNGFRCEEISNEEIVKPGLGLLDQPVENSVCEKFLETLYHEICKNKNEDLRKEISMHLQVREIRYGKDALGKNDCIKGKMDDVKEDMSSIKENVTQIREKLERKDVHLAEFQRKICVENRAEEYASKWERNVFLNDFNKRDADAGVNVKLRELYLEEFLPQYIRKCLEFP